jgi:antitoxin (DNA-binding transcriptional repressor) of toxin-antitoxin stability system
LWLPVFETQGWEHRYVDDDPTDAVAPSGLNTRQNHKEWQYNRGMADRVIHISEAEAASDFASVLARVRAGAEIVIESGKLPVAVIHAPAPPRRSISECIALLPEDSTAVMDPDFAKDIEAAIESHREPLEPPAWD